jgi:hypothetical protein
MLWMRAYPLLGQVGGGWALEFESFLGPVKWHRAECHLGPKKLENCKRLHKFAIKTEICGILPKKLPDTEHGVNVFVRVIS